MRKMPEFVREDEKKEKEAVRPAVTANLTGWETVIFQVVEEPESDSASATAAFAP